MPDKTMPGPVQDSACVREAVCIHTKKIYDSCKDKDCIEDLRFYPTQSAQSVIERAVSIRAGKAELLYVYIDVEPVGFNRGFFTVDVRYYYKVTAEAFVGAARPVEISGLCVFDKRVILFGSEGAAKIFSSQTALDGMDEQLLRQSNLPTAVVEATALKQSGGLYLRRIWAASLPDNRPGLLHVGAAAPIILSPGGLHGQKQMRSITGSSLFWMGFMV